jgi:hypothetical protein
MTMKCQRAVVLTILTGVLTASVQAAGAASLLPQPTVDLGETSFLDGEAGPGGLLEVIGNGYTANYATDSRGNAVPGTNSQASTSLTLHVAYLSNIPALDGHLGVEFLLPFAAVHLNVPGVPETTQGGVGDVTIAPFIQWSDLLLAGEAFSMRFGLQGVVPTGSYSPERLINMGQNVWQFSPYYAFTWHATTDWEISGRLIYDWSSRNLNPPAILQATSAQPGDQIALNLSASYAVSPHWRIGLASYGLRQLNPTRVNDVAVPGSEQQVFALGPAVLWSNNQLTVLGNVYREFATENRPEGFNAVFRVLKPF